MMGEAASRAKLTFHGRLIALSTLFFLGSSCLLLFEINDVVS